MTNQLNDLTEIKRDADLTDELRQQIYSYLTINELIDIVINLSSKERAFIGDNSDEEYFEWSDNR